MPAATDNRLKPSRGNISLGLIAPGWRWAWQNLEGLWPWWEGGGNRLYDVSGKGAHGAGVGTTRSWTATPLGWGTAHAGNDGFDMGNPSGIKFLASQEWTVWTVTAMIQQTGSGQAFIGRYNTNNQRQFLVWYQDSPTRIQVYDNNDTLRLTGNTITLGNYHLVIVTCNGSGQIALWTYDLTAGKWIDQGLTGTHVDQANPTAANLYLADIQQAPAPFQGRMLLAGYNLFKFPDAAIAQLAGDPFGPFRPWWHDFPARLVQAASPTARRVLVI